MRNEITDTSVKKVLLLLTAATLLSCNHVDFMGVKIDQPSDKFFEQLSKSEDFFVDETSAAGMAYGEMCLIFKSSHRYHESMTTFRVYFHAYDDYYILTRKLENIRDNLIDRYGNPYVTEEEWRDYANFKDAMKNNEDLPVCAWKLGDKTIALSISGYDVILSYRFLNPN